MMLNRSDIVKIPFPFSDLSCRKQHPVLLLCAPDAYGDFLAVAITSQAGHEDGVALQNDDLVDGQLPKASWVRARRLFSLNCGTVITKLGCIKPAAFERIHGKICENLGCQPCDTDREHE